MMIRVFGLAGLLLAAALGLIACSETPAASDGAQPGASIGPIQPSKLGGGGGGGGY